MEFWVCQGSHCLPANSMSLGIRQGAGGWQECPGEQGFENSNALERPMQHAYNHGQRGVKTGPWSSLVVCHPSKEARVVASQKWAMLVFWPPWFGDGLATGLSNQGPADPTA